MNTTSSESATAARRWFVEPTRSDVEFTVPNLWRLITVTGRFDRFDGTYTIGPGRREIELSIDADSLDTGRGARDRHLRSADFFHVTEHPSVHLKSTDIVDAGDGALKVVGELEAAGKTVPLVFEATVRALGDELELE